MKEIDIGQMLAPDQLMTLKSCGKCQGPHGMYELFIDQKGQPVVRSENSQRKFLLKWEHIVEIAVNNGVDDTGWVPKHYNMECEGGRFEQGKFASVPFEKKQ
jgi:hypothetical protein